jgi:hypothetical protein
VLINRPRAWSTVFATQKDRRSFVEACLERSHPAPLDVTMDVSEVARVRPGCTCNKDKRRRFLPSQKSPCEWHFQFESLAEPKHSDRIRALTINFDGRWVPVVEGEQLALGSCRLFTSAFPQLITLTWKNEETKYANHLFSIPPFPPTLRSLTYVGPWHGLIAPVNNLTSFVLESDSGPRGTSAEAVRLFMLNNQSLESLELKYIDFVGYPKDPPVQLLNLKTLRVGLAHKGLSAIIRVPALCRLSTLRISPGDTSTYTLYATGGGIVFSIECFAHNLTEIWDDFTGYAGPTIHHIRLDDGPEVGYWPGHDIAFVSLLLDAHTLEIGNDYFPPGYDGLLDDLKRLGPQLKTIRFAISDELEPFKGSVGYEDWGGGQLDRIEELVKYRFEQG